MLQETLLKLELRILSPYLAAQETEALLDIARRQFPEGQVYGMQLIVRLLEVVDKGPIVLMPETGTGEARCTVHVRAEVFTIDKNETLHGCVVGAPMADFDLATKKRVLQIAPGVRLTVPIQIVLVEKPAKPLKLGEQISVVVADATYSRQTGQLGAFGRLLTPATLPTNEFMVGAGSLEPAEVARLQEQVRTALEQIAELERAYPKLAAARQAKYGKPQGSTPLLTLLAAPPNMRVVRMPHPWTGRVDVAPLGGLKLTEPANVVLEALVQVLKRAVREQADLALASA